MVASSGMTTMLPSPLPINDISFIATLQAFNNLYWFSIIIFVMTLSDMIFAIITYYLGHRLTDRFVKSEKAIKRLDDIKGKLESNKWADLWVFLASATPLPFTFTIYGTAILEYEIKKFVPIIFFGRLVKYTILAIAFYLGYNLIGG